MRAARIWTAVAVCGTALVGGLCVAVAALTGPYNIVQYRTDTHPALWVRAMSSDGIAVGYWQDRRPFLAKDPHTIVSLTDYGGSSEAEVTAVNNLGQAVGDTPYTAKKKDAFHACLWDVPHTAFVDLGTLGGDSSVACGINDAGDIVGYSMIADGSTHAFLRPAGGHMSDLGTLGGQWSAAKAINSTGQIAAYMYDGEAVRGIFYDHGSVKDIGDFGGGMCEPTCINDHGCMAGGATATDGMSRAFFWSPAGGLVNLGCLGGDASAMAINNKGQTVGFSYMHPDCGRPEHAFVANPQGRMWDLKVLARNATGEHPANLVEATGITSTGQIAVNDHQDFSARDRCYLMLPKSQPSDAGGGTALAVTLTAQALEGRAAVVQYHLAAPASVCVEVRNIAGRPVRRIPVSGVEESGSHELAWNLLSDNGSAVPAGTYLVVLTARAADGQQVQAMQRLVVSR